MGIRVFWTTAFTALVAGALAGCSSRSPVPPLPAGASGIGAVRTKGGVLVTELASFEGGIWVRTPCFGVTVVHDATPVQAIDVLLDPGHGGNEDGAIGPNGLKEKDVNLAVAQRVRARLESSGRRVAMTRDGDLRQTVRTRGELAASLRPKVFISIHHNAGGPPPQTGKPGTQVFHQASSDLSLQLAQALWREITTAFGRIDIAWSSDDQHPGVEARLGEDGLDYYGVLRYADRVPAVITEAAFISNPPEAELMKTDQFRDVEAQAIADAINTTFDDSSLSAPRTHSGEGTPPPTVGTGSKGTPPGTSPSTESAIEAEGSLPARPPDADDCTDPPLE